RTRPGLLCLWGSSHLKCGAWDLSPRGRSFRFFTASLAFRVLIRGLLKALVALRTTKVSGVRHTAAERNLIRFVGELLQNCVIDREFVLRFLQPRVRVRHSQRNAGAITRLRKQREKLF